jgi:hypothetical protein
MDPKTLEENKLNSGLKQALQEVTRKLGFN